MWLSKTSIGTTVGDTSATVRVVSHVSSRGGGAEDLRADGWADNDEESAANRAGARRWERMGGPPPIHDWRPARVTFGGASGWHGLNRIGAARPSEHGQRGGHQARAEHHRPGERPPKTVEEECARPWT